MEQIFTVKNLLVQAWEYNIEIYQIFSDFQSACDSIQRDKWYKMMKHFGIPNKLKRLMKVTVNDVTYHVKIGLMINDGFKVGDGL